MTLLVWDTKYSVRIRKLDEQHQTLFALLNALYDGMQEELGRDIIGAALGTLVDYVAYHFNFEEMLFGQHGYAAAEHHITGHAVLMERLNTMKQKFDAGQTNVTLDMLRFLSDWLNNHIMGEDKAYVDFLTSRGVT